MDSSDLWKLDATAQAALVARVRSQRLELVDAAIARIERLNPQINAVITPMFESAGARRAMAISAMGRSPACRCCSKTRASR